MLLLVVVVVVVILVVALELVGIVLTLGLQGVALCPKAL